MKLTLTSDKSKIKRNINAFLTLKGIKELQLEGNLIKLLSNPKEKEIEVRDSKNNIHKAFRWILEIEMENTQFTEIQLTHPQYDKFIDMWKDSDSDDKFYLNNIHQPKGKTAYMFQIEFFDKSKSDTSLEEIVEDEIEDTIIEDEIEEVNTIPKEVKLIFTTYCKDCKNDYEIAGIFRNFLGDDRMKEFGNAVLALSKPNQVILNDIVGKLNQFAVNKVKWFIEKQEKALISQL